MMILKFQKFINFMQSLDISFISKIF